MIKRINDRHELNAWQRSVPRAESEKFLDIVKKHRSESLRAKNCCSLVVLEFNDPMPKPDAKVLAADILTTAGGPRVEVGVMGCDHLGLLLPGVAGTRASRIAGRVCRELSLVMREPRYEVFALPSPELLRSTRKKGIRRFSRHVSTPASEDRSLMFRGPSERCFALSQAWGEEWKGVLEDAVSTTLVPTWKRILDVTVSLVALVLLTPVLLLLALSIKLVSPGPILFRQERVGLKGSRFMCLKFRSMHQNADATAHKDHLKHLMNSDQKMTKLDKRQDERLIPMAGFIRATGLDELPQLLNILFGDMSLVGPRPCTVYEYEQYQPWHISRFDTLPGLTGLWQVSGKNRLSFNEMMHLDISYAQAKTLWLDLKIIALTPGAVARQVLDSKRKKK